jgi:hypothetical protein
LIIDLTSITYDKVTEVAHLTVIRIEQLGANVTPHLFFLFVIFEYVYIRLYVSHDNFYSLIMGKAKFDLEKIPLRDGSSMYRALASRNIEPGENICSIGYDIDYLLIKLGLKPDVPLPRIVRGLTGIPLSATQKDKDSNCEYYRDETQRWILRSTKNIKENRHLVVDQSTVPWFVGSFS